MPGGPPFRLVLPCSSGLSRTGFNPAPTGTITMAPLPARVAAPVADLYPRDGIRASPHPAICRNEATPATINQPEYPVLQGRHRLWMPTDPVSAWAPCSWG